MTPASPMIVKDVLRNRSGGELSHGERAVIEASVAEIRSYAAGELVVRQGVEVDISTLLIRGFMTRHIDGRDGRRHMVGMHVAGDFVDLHAYALKRLDHDVSALTDITIAVVPHSALQQIQRDHPHLTRRLWFITLLDAAMHRQWVYRLSSLSALSRVAHFLCETNARLLAVGASDGGTFGLPMTQVDIGEVCGLTNVHVNRVLRELREMGLCSMRFSIVDIHDLAGLAAVAQFTPDYLYLNPEMAQRARGVRMETP